jgi:ABC-type branched-subunit amino acid transport system ATPase component/MFS family permease
MPARATDGQRREGQRRRRPSPVTAPEVAHVDEIHRAEQTVEELALTQQRLREKARAVLGITGETGDVPPLAEGMARSGVGWYPLIALALLLVVDQFQTWGFAVLGPEISRSLGVSRGLLAFLVLLKTLSVMLASLPMAAYVQHRPRRALVAKVTAFGWSLATLCSGFVINVWGLLLVLVTDGVSTGSVEAVHRPLLIDSYPPEVRVRALSVYRGAFAVGTITAPLLTGLVTSVLGFTWRGVFVAMGVVCIAAAAASVRLRDPGFGRWDTEQVRRAVRTDTGVAPDEVPASETALGFFEIVRRLMLIPTIRRVLAAWAVVGVMIFPFYTFLFFYLEDRWNMGPGARSLFLAAVWVLALPVLAWFGRRGEAMFRADPAQLIRLVSLALLVFVVALAIGVASPVFAIMAIAFAVVFAIGAMLVPALSIVMLSIIPPAMRPHASALAGIFLAGVGGMGGVLLLNGIDRRFGIGGAIVSMAIPGVIAALVIRTAAGTVNQDLDRMIDELVEREEIQVLQRQGRHLPMLACRHVDFSYGQLQVLFDVNFTVDDGETVALLGTNGAGKSTLLRVISGLGLPSRGTVHFRGADVTYLDAERRLRLGITQIPGGRAIFGPLTVVENIRVYGHSLGRDRAAVDRGVEATFDAFPRLAERRNQLASTLSGGEQQMLALGKAFVLEPQLLLIDELSLGLAPKIVAELLEMVRRINAAGTAVVLVEQSVNIALSLVDHAYFMEKGEIRFDGAATDLLDRRDLLRSVFLEGATKGLR